MNIGAIIGNIASDLHGIGVRLISASASVQGVPFVGGVLSSLFFGLGVTIALNAARLVTAASQIDSLVNMAVNGFVANPMVQRLIDYGNRIIDFIDNPAGAILQTIRAEFPSIYEALRNTYAFIRPHVESIVRTVFSFLNDPKGNVKSFLSELIPQFPLLSGSPAKWVFDLLKTISSNISALLTDPDGWLKGKVRAFFPDLWSLIQDPKGFVTDKVMDGLDALTARYLPRIVKLAERILNLVF